MGLAGATPSPSKGWGPEGFSDCALPPSQLQQNTGLKGWRGTLELTQYPHGCPGLRAGESAGVLGLLPLDLGDATSSVSAGDYYSLVQVERELALGGRTCSSKGCSREWRQGPGPGSVSGQWGIPTSAGGGDGVLLHQALRPQAAPQCPLTRELGTERSEVGPTEVPCPTCIG